MRIVTWTIRLVLFVLLAAFGAKNVDPVTLRFYFDLAVEAPLILVLFGAFAVGVVFGVLALVPAVVRQKRAISALKREAAAPADAAPADAVPPPVPPL